MEELPEVAAPRRGRPVALLATLAGAALVATGLVAWWARPEPGPVTPVRVEPAPAGRTAGGATSPSEGGSPSLPAAQRAPRAPGDPRRVEVPALGVRSAVVPVRAPGGVLTPPADPQLLGWWADGARPGAPRGSALVAGHTVQQGGGALDDLERLAPGDRVWVRSDRGRLGYAVRSTLVLGKGELARRAEELFDQTVPGRLVIITCEDWDGAEYRSNVVVTATPVR